MKSNFTVGRLLLGSLCAASLIGAFAVRAQAQDERSATEPARAGTYLNGGIGTADQDRMRSIARDWPLRMSFSELTGNFVASVNLVVADKRGTRHLQLQDAGPMTYVKLPAGTYRITATYHGQAQTQEVTLDGKTGRDVFFRWKGA